MNKKDNKSFIITKMKIINNYQIIKEQIIIDVINICKKEHIDIWHDFINKFKYIK
jgi:hypothetical protein